MEGTRRFTGGAADGAADRVHLSIVSPVYLGAEMVDELVARVAQHAAEITDDFEIVLVDDGSPDDGWVKIAEHCHRDPRVKGIKLSRNFGQHSALSAGLRAARGDWIIVLDCDLQDDPAFIPDLYWKAREGHDIVFTRKRQRQHRGLRDLVARGFHRVLNVLVSSRFMRTEAVIGNYSALSRRAVDAFNEIHEYHRQYLGVLRWLGFEVAYLDIEHRERPVGRSSYTFRKLVREAAVAITSQSDRLLYTSIAVGFVFVALSFLGVAVLAVLWLTRDFLEGWPSLMVVLLLSTGLILLSLGIVGIYVGKIFEQVKERPVYVVQESLNIDAAPVERQPVEPPVASAARRADADA